MEEWSIHIQKHLELKPFFEESGDGEMDKLLLELESIREKMVRAGMKYGLQAPKTIFLSKQFDQVFNQYIQKSLHLLMKK